MRTAAVLLLFLLVSACGVAGGSGGGGDDGPTLPPADPVPVLEGTWCGPAVDGADANGAICVHIDAEGNIDRLVINGATVAAGTIQTTAEARVFRFALSNGGAGFLALSTSDQHLVYLDNTRLLAVLDATSPTLPASYLRTDIRDDWSGYSLFINDAGDILGTQDSGLSVLAAFGFNGAQGGIPFQEAGGSTLQVTQAVFGRYSARYIVPAVESGDLMLSMSPDKQCIGGTRCRDGGAFPDDCSIVIWERVP